MTSPDHEPGNDNDHDHSGHDHDHDHSGHDHSGHDHDHSHGEEPKFDPAKYEGLSGWEIRSVSECEHELVAAAPRARFEESVEAAAKKLAKRVTVRGFRPGKVPVPRVKQMFAEDVNREAVEKLVNDTWNEALAEKKLAPIGPPKLSELSLGDPERVMFSLRFEMLPVIELAGLDGMQISPKSVSVTPQDLDSEMQGIRLMRAKFVPSEASEAGPGQFAVITLLRWEPGTGREGEPAETREGLVVEMGNERNIPELDGALLGMTVGEMRDFDAEVDTGADPPKAKTAFRVLLKELRRRELPELDLELVNSLGIGEFDSVDAFQSEVRRRMVEHRTEMARREQEAEAMEHLLRSNAFGMPPSMIQSEAEARLRKGVENLVRRGVDVESAPINWASELQRLREMAEKDLRADWLLELAARAKGVEVSEEDVDKEVAGLAAERQEHPAAVRAALEKNNEINHLRASIKRRRTLDLLRSGASIQIV